MSNSIMKIYNTLDKEQVQFIQSKTIDTTNKLKWWVDFLRPVAQMDKLNDYRRKKKSAGIILIIILLVLSLFFGFGYPMIFIVSIIMVVLLIIQIKKVNKLTSLDIGNHLRMFLMPLIIVLKEESDENAKAHIKFDASSPVSAKKLVKSINDTNKGYPKIKTEIYNHPWLDADLLLADGTIMKFDFNDLVVKKRITKRGTSGKIKTKNKIKIKHNLCMKISFRKDHYQVNNLNNTFIYSETGEYHNFKVKYKLIRYSLEEITIFNDMLGMISSAYQNVKVI